MEYKEGDLVLCTVEQISNAVTTVILPDGTKGTIISSEIASGRIKFMRDYVVPNKKIVCKVLSVSNGHVALSLRRVNVKERKAVLQEYKLKQALEVAFKQLLKEDFDNVCQKIFKDYSELMEFMDSAREDEKLLEKYIPKECREKIAKIINKKRKQVELKYEVELKCLKSDGVKIIKKLFEGLDASLKVTYISAGKYSLKYLCDDFKKGKQEIKDSLEKLEESAKKEHCEFNLKEIR